ncbi:MAG: hypothetical protein KGJ75_16320 [Alphaproteobacteria bacterium]|nr:hypothetical protein [Alphaproteobacteria bacterium]
MKLRQLSSMDAMISPAFTSCCRAALGGPPTDRGKKDERAWLQSRSAQEPARGRPIHSGQFVTPFLIAACCGHPALRSIGGFQRDRHTKTDEA